MALPAKSASQLLAGSLKQHPSLQHVLAQGERILRATRLYESLVPAPLLRVSRVANIKSGILVVHADHGAAAAKLKQLSRYLVDEFLKKGFEFTGIDIRVQPGLPHPPGNKPRPKPLSKQALAFMQDAAEKMGADSHLRQRIEDFVAHAPRADATIKGE